MRGIIRKVEVCGGMEGPGPGQKYVFSFSTSWLYSYYFGGDSAQLLTMGKAWYLGKLPYVDMFDHKGPFIFIVVLDALKLRRMLI